MDWSALARWEWLLIEVLILGWAIRELISVRRERRKAAEAAAAKRSADDHANGSAGADRARNDESR